MGECIIKNLPELLNKFLGPSKTLKHSKISNLIGPGENYGSIMLKLDLTVEDKDGGPEKILYAVAKILPKMEIMREMFNVQVTYKNEIAFYEIIVPTLREFQKEMGITKVIDCFAECYGARLNLTNSDKVDDDAVLVLENLNVSGFSNIDRMKGFDLEGAKLVLKDIATVHALSLALKLKKPEVFEKRIKTYCKTFKVPDMLDVMKEAAKEIILENTNCAYLAPKISIWGDRKKIDVREPFATLVHCDLWANNTMLKFDDGKPVANKLVDFQIYNYGSPAQDLFLFLWSSVAKEVLEDNLDFLIKYYHEHFIHVLIEYECDIEPFGFDNFLEEIRLEADTEFGHALQFLLFVVHGKKQEFDFNKMPTKEEMLMVPLIAKEKAWFMVMECEKRGWLY